jgi:RNA ligase (TIGR02306 family)
MSDWNCQVCRIEKLEKHPNADSLSIATVMSDYPVVVKTEDYHLNQLVGYIAIDTIVPDTEQFYFLSPKNIEKYEENGEIKTRPNGMKYPLGSVPEKNRVIKAKKIRNVYSQGMLVPAPPHLQEGDSLVEVLNLKKVVEEEEENITKFKNSNAEKPPTNWAIPYYDIEGIRKYINCFRPQEEITITEKLHGSNAAFCYDGQRLWVKSRNFYKKLDPDDMWWDLALRYNLEEKLSKFPKLVFFGEAIGQVKGFRYDSSIKDGKLHTTVHFFDVYDAHNNRYLDYQERVDKINQLELSPAPELYRGPWLGKEHAYQFAEGMSTLNSKHVREGAVIVPLHERFEPRLNGRLQLKIIGQGYNLLK